MMTPLEFIVLAGIVLAAFAIHLFLQARNPRTPIQPLHRRCDRLRPRQVLILTAAIGGGHEAAGRALATELRAAGHEATTIDGLHLLSARLECMIREGYARQIVRAPWSWGLLFHVVAFRPIARIIRGLVGFSFARRLLPLIDDFRPDVVVSTYPLVTAALGHLRRRGQVAVPVVASISDFGVHPLWVAPDADLHVVASSASAELARRAGGVATVGRLPVAPAFEEAIERDAARASLDIPPDAFTVLIVGGAWGVGDLEGAALCAAQAGASVIVITGHNGALLERLRALFAPEGHVRILGWSTDMPLLMRAADCLIQNAGGMTCIEASAVGLPILVYHPLPGHGILNARVMEQSGVVRRARDHTDLQKILNAAARNDLRLAPPHRAIAPALSSLVVSVALDGVIPVPASAAARPTRVVARAALVASLVVALLPFSRHDAFGAMIEVDEHIDNHPRIERVVDHRPHVSSYYHHVR